jgi:hypothetical protein
LPIKRWPIVVSLALTPAKENFSGLPLATATIHRIGRMKRAPSMPVQVIERGQVRS